MIQNHRLVEATFQQTPNHGGKLHEPKYIVVHYTAGRSAAASARWLCDPKAKASAHLVIGRDGSLIQLANFNVVTWHAGQSEWQGLHGLNNYAIGLELDNAGMLAKVNGRWRSLALGQDYANADVVELPHKNGGPVRGWMLYSQAQLAMLEDICRELVAAYPTIVDVIGHDDIAGPQVRTSPHVKWDPGPAMPLDVIRSKVFGRGE